MGLPFWINTVAECLIFMLVQYPSPSLRLLRIAERMQSWGISCRVYICRLVVAAALQFMHCTECYPHFPSPSCCRESLQVCPHQDSYQWICQNFTQVCSWVSDISSSRAFTSRISCHLSDPISGTSRNMRNLTPAAWHLHTADLCPYTYLHEEHHHLQAHANLDRVFSLFTRIKM